ncbi:MAG: signal peptidase I [Myxococcota bacterium]
MIPIRPPLAMALALFIPGAGHLYAGWPRHALLLAVSVPSVLLMLSVATALEMLSISLFVPLVCLIPSALQIGAAVDAGRKARTPILAPNRISNRAFVVVFALVSLAATLFTSIGIERTTLSARRMSSATMTPNLLVGDYVILRRPWFMSTPAPGDILEFRFPRDRRFTYLQRVLAVGGQTLQFDGTPPVIDDVAGAWTEERAVDWLAADCALQPGEQVVERLETAAYSVLLPTEPEVGVDLSVPDSTVYVVNDNRRYRGDSRKFGPVERSEVSGQVLGIGFSWDACAGSVRLDRVGALANP